MERIKKEIAIITAVLIGVAELVSLPTLGLSGQFPYGLALGGAVSILCLHLLSAAIGRALASGRKGAIYFGLILRIVIYGGALIFALRTGLYAGLGCMVGYLLPAVAIPVRTALLPKLRALTGKAPIGQVRYVRDGHSRRLERAPYFLQYRRGRAYLTHRHFPTYRREIV